MATTNNKNGYWDAGAGKADTGEKMKVGQNLGRPYYWTGCFPFINVMKTGYVISDTSVPGTKDANGYIDASTSGSWRLITHVPESNFMSQGTAAKPWVLRWTGTGTVTWTGGVVESSAPNRIEYSSPSIPTGSYWVNVTAGAPTNIELLAPGEEDRFDAGNILHSDFVSDLSGVDTARMMDWQDTSGSVIRDYSDINTYDYVSWSLQLSSNGEVNIELGIPIQALCEACNEMSCDLWLCIPHQATDACVTSIATDVSTFLDIAGGLRVYFELSNEVWNSALPWSDEHVWLTNGDVASQEATVNPATAACASAGHGLTYGDGVACFANTIQSTWPWAFGSQQWVAVTDANNFKIGRGKTTFPYDPLSIVSITQANPAVVEITAHPYSNGDDIAIFGGDMTQVNDGDYIIGSVTADTFELTGVDSTAFTPYISGGKAFEIVTPLPDEVTFLRYKRVADSVKTLPVNFAERNMAVWDLCEAQVGGANMYRVAGCWANNVQFMIDQLAVIGYREVVDWFSIAPYCDTRSIAPDYENYSNTQMTDYLMFVQPDEKWNAFMDNHVNALGEYRFNCYECGTHNGGTTTTPTQQAKLLSWARDKIEAKRAYEFHFRAMSTHGMNLACHYFSHSAYVDSGNTGNTYGCMEHLGEKDAAEFLGMVSFFNGGGAPRL